MRNPYAKHYYEFDELCIVRNMLELQSAMNFMVQFNIDCGAQEFDRGAPGCRFIVVPKGNLKDEDLMEARVALSGLLFGLRLGMSTEYQEKLRNKPL
jgi:hypothetical protein